ncbi:hypothetical protein N802_09365 [Knoellia sinensis KCTC 19936]|uniref:Uncharacterized protein n=1 Tax=Knoellia sinensis KCTC 19936 TaxID=1385520 RepID=A0A0A0J0T3_9MICO|nr:hypothetical protein N802_09365 [Knoellia sinensis KCTC 19936]
MGVATSAGEPAVVGPVRERTLLRRTLGVLIVAMWMAWAVVAWWSSLHEVGEQHFVEDVRAGRVVAFKAVTNVRDEPWRFGSGVGAWMVDYPGADLEGRPEEGAVADGLIYTVDGVRTRWLSEPPGLVRDMDAFAALAEAGAKPFTAETFPPSRDWMAFPALAAFLFWIASLIATPPRWGTRPFWVLVAFVPAGLGLLAYAARELLAGPPAVERAPGLRWWHGLGIAVLGALFVPPLVVALI